MGQSRAASHPAPAEPAGRVLVVDDDADIRDLVAIKLTAAGHDVVARADGDGALAAAREGGWSAIVLDVMMPGPSGIEVLRAIRASGDATPVLLLTARGQEHDIAEGLEAGADGYMTKPFSPRELLERVTAILR